MKEKLKKRETHKCLPSILIVIIIRYPQQSWVIRVRTEVLKYERIRSIRIDKGLTQKEIARIINVKQNTYSQYEVGVLNYPLDVVIKLAVYYETSVDYLVGLTDDPTPYERQKAK